MTRRRNRITSLLGPDETWVYRDSELQNLVSNFFKDLYSSAGQGNVHFPNIFTFPDNNSMDRTLLETPVTLEETRLALFSMKNFKSPGPDGFHPIFFKSQWDSFYKLVSDCFTDPSKIGNMNKTLLTLIPKKTEVSQVNHLRPIALCNVSYKIITKILSQRLRTFLPYTISNAQSSFLPGRSTTDNIIVLQEIIHSFSHLHDKKGYMILKLDLEKAYDRLEWNFLSDTLRLLKLSDSICLIIYHCVSTAPVSINWNEDNSLSFTTSRGIRQGDPISPYLFILAIERLCHRIKDLVNSGIWKGFKIGRGDTHIISHICFADDLVIVAEANFMQVQMIMGMLEEFCNCSGQKVNLAKSKVFFSSNTDVTLSSDLSRALGIEKTHDLGMYLGAPMLYQRASKLSYSYFLDKMRKS